MDLLANVFNAIAIAAVGALVTLFLNSRTKDLKKDLTTELRSTKAYLKAEITELKTDVRDGLAEVNRRIDGSRAEMNERFRDEGKEISSLRSDVTQLALALGQRPRPQAG